MANQTKPAEQDTEDRSVGKRTYKQFLGIIRANVGGIQPPMAAKSAVGIRLCSYADRPAKTLDNAIIVGRDQKDDIVEWTDENDRECLALKQSAYDKISGAYPYSEDDISAIEEIIKTETARDSVDKEVVGWANTQLLKIESLSEAEGESGEEAEGEGVGKDEADNEQGDQEA